MNPVFADRHLSLSNWRLVKAPAGTQTHDHQNDCYVAATGRPAPIVARRAASIGGGRKGAPIGPGFELALPIHGLAGKRSADRSARRHLLKNSAVSHSPRPLLQGEHTEKPEA